MARKAYIVTIQDLDDKEDYTLAVQEVMLPTLQLAKQVVRKYRKALRATFKIWRLVE
jgi:hypothetical protein